MKKTVGFVVGVAVLGAAGYLGSRLTAQQTYPQAGVPASPPAVSRVAVVNLGQVIKNYAKFKNFTTEFQAKDLQVRKLLESKQAEAAQLQAAGQKPDATVTQQQEIERKLRDLQRQVQDMKEDAANRLSKERYDVLLAIYKEIEEAVKVYARAKNLELVLHYNDAVGQDLYLPEIFQRRLANNACIPIYSHPDLDITNQITMMLNQRVQGPSAPAQPVQR